jgi:hypothetical protein
VSGCQRLPGSSTCLDGRVRHRPARFRGRRQAVNLGRQDVDGVVLALDSELVGPGGAVDAVDLLEPGSGGSFHLEPRAGLADGLPKGAMSLLLGGTSGSEIAGCVRRGRDGKLGVECAASLYDARFCALCLAAREFRETASNLDQLASADTRIERIRARLGP